MPTFFRSMPLTLLLGLGWVVSVCQMVQAEDKTPERWAVLIGVDDYNQLNKLQYAGADMKALGEELIRAGFPTDQVFLLHDGAKDKKYLPFRENIERQLNLVLGLAAEGDLVLVAFSGHGVWLNNQGWLCPTEARLEDPDGTLVAVNSIYDRLAKSKAALKLMMVDACRNVPPETTGRRSARAIAEANTALATTFERPPEGIMLLASCAPGQISMEEKDFGHGVFMHFVLEGMRGRAADEEGNVSLTRLYDYASLNTKKYVARKFNEYQTPALKGELNGPFELARLDGKQPLINSKNARAGETIRNGIGMKLTLIPAGEFTMGSEETVSDLMREFPDANPAWFAGEKPQHPVRITKPFFLGTHEVTLGQFLQFYHDAKYKCESERDGRGGWGWSPEDSAQRPSYVPWSWGFTNQTNNCPVVNITWNDAVAFCEWLSKREGKVYRLPTEAEWEYACRAGSTHRFSFGEDAEELSRYGNTADQAYRRLFPNPDRVVMTKFENGKMVKTDMPFPFLSTSDGFGHTAPVGSFRPNAFGLYDMHGNAYEWCSDWYDTEYYSQSPTNNPTGPDSGALRVVRGGGWLDRPFRCRAPHRLGSAPQARGIDVGFRVVCEQ